MFRFACSDVGEEKTPIVTRGCSTDAASKRSSLRLLPRMNMGGKVQVEDRGKTMALPREQKKIDETGHSGET